MHYFSVNNTHRHKDVLPEIDVSDINQVTVALYYNYNAECFSN